MRVNELAHEAKVAAHVVRFYARTSLLKPRKNPANGYRLFTHEDIKRVRFIRTAQCLGYTLAEIREMLALLDRGNSACELMETILRQRLAHFERKTAALQQTQRLMQQALFCLQKRIWDTGDVEALCNHLQALESQWEKGHPGINAPWRSDVQARNATLRGSS